MKEFTNGVELKEGVKVHPALIIETKDESICIIQDKTEVILITDKTEYEDDYSGLVTFVNEDGIELESCSMIMWEYIKEVCIMT